MNRHKAREVALKMIFQMDVGKNTLELAMSTLDEALPETASAGASQRQFIMQLVENTSAHFDELDAVISTYISDWSLDRLANVDKNILRMAICELRYLTGIPPAVTINEAVQLAKEYGGSDAGAFVNGVLDNYRKHLSETENKNA